MGGWGCSSVRMSLCMGGPVSQLMTKYSNTISVLNTRISSHEWFLQPITHNVEDFTQLQEEERQLGGGLSLRDVSCARTWGHRRHARATDFSPFSLCFMIPEPPSRVVLVTWRAVMGRRAWSCGAVILLAIICCCRAATLDSIHWTSSNAK